MCGRYTVFTDAESLELEAIIHSANTKYGSTSYRTGEIFPTDKVPVIAAGGGDSASLAVTLMIWGWREVMPRLLINARAETVREKLIFRHDFSTRRCVIPSTGFYEWSHDGEKTKYLFNLPGQPMLYMAGFWRQNKGFLILTTEANASMRDVHSRMPLILSAADVRGYVADMEVATHLLNRPTPELARMTEMA